MQPEQILLERVFNSDREEISLLPRLLEEIRPRCPIDDTGFFNLVVALTEAVNNAIDHGNKFDPAKEVHYRVICTSSGIRCVVEDQGEGFDITNVADPTSPDNILSEGGRGLFLIQALMSDVRFEQTATGTRLEFFLPRSSASE
jgi:serine/threonine-protein kinase RsbW